jgi:tricorn protease
VEQGRVQAVNADTRQVRRIAVTADMDVDFDQEKLEIFHEAWSYLGRNFFDAKMNGVDWTDVERRWLPFVAGSATRDELRRMLMLMIGELNASHLRVTPPGAIPPAIGKIGVKFDPTVYERNGALTVSSVIPLSPAAVAGLQTGDTLTAIAGVPISRSTDFDAAMANTIGRRVVLRVRSSAG